MTFKDVWFHGLATLNVAAVELYERYQSRSHPTGQVGQVLSNGVASHYIEERAKKAALNELIERDSVLFHFVTGKSALCTLDLKQASSKAVDRQSFTGMEEIEKFLSFFSKVYIHLLSSSDKNTLVFQCDLAFSDGRALGWATLNMGDLTKVNSVDEAIIVRGIVKSFKEALSALRVFHSPRLKYLKENHGQILSEVNNHNFADIAKRLGILPGELQMGLVLFHPNFSAIADGFQAASISVSLDSIGKACSKGCFRKGDFQRHYDVVFERMDRDTASPLYTYRASAKNTLTPTWPFLDYEFLKSHEGRFPTDQLKKEKAAFPTIIY